ncbi:MAG: Na+/H+ antiporter [Vampirovibrionia bacterium]
MSVKNHIQAINENISTLDIQTMLFILVIAATVAMLTKRIKIPYTLALVLVGLLFGSLELFPTVELTPNLVLFVFLPPLLFEAAWNVHFKLLKENFLPIILYAVIGLIMSVFLIGVTLHFGLGMPIIIALLFGAMISATDPVSVIALFKQLGLPKRLATLVEGESLFNDGTSVVIFHIILAVALTGSTKLGDSYNLLFSGILEFIVVVLGGAFVGLAIGWLFSSITAHYDDPPLEITLTALVAYGSFVLAESIPVPFTGEDVNLHLSGVIATVVAGLVMGNFGRFEGMSATTRISVTSFWECATFIVNSFVFLMIGLHINLVILYEHINEIFWGIIVILVGRVVVIYGITSVLNINLKDKISTSWQHIMFWGGLRGSLSMALALSLPIALKERQSIIVMVFGVVLFTLIVQGLSISKLINWLGLTSDGNKTKDYELTHGNLLACNAAIKELDNIYSRGEIADLTYNKLHNDLITERNNYSAQLDNMIGNCEALLDEQHSSTKRYLLEVKNDTINHLLRSGTINEEAYDILTENFNEAIEQISLDHEEDKPVDQTDK